jgi:hypothetical protein
MISRITRICGLIGLLFLVAAAAMAGPVDLNDPVFQDFNRILFVKAEQGGVTSEHHMVDEYFGFNAHTNSGNGLFILENAFRGSSYLTNVLDGQTVENGVYQGQSLTGGGFLSPDLNYEGDKIVFCWTEGVHSQTWNQTTTYHIFKCNLDGSNLRELTSGNDNDIHPNWMPDGNIIFISERRGGDGRCHQRPCPTFTLHTMDEWGGNLRCISYHETNEWWPSIDHNGMVVYTRWDYVDRGATHTHSAWITKPDGHNARQLVLNYTNSGSPEYGLGNVPMMQMQVRAIPGSNKYMATAAPHHWECYGEVIVIDAEIEDDDWNSTITRFTTNNGYPESNGGGHKYGSPYPLSEEFALVAYSPTDNGRWDLYAIDNAANTTLLYNDSTLSCQSPVPVKSRPKPITYYGSTDPGPNPDDATIHLTNVYNSLLPLPGGETITELRIWEPLVKSTSYADNPSPSYESTESDWAGRNIKALLGSVPVEADGSAKFYVPANRPILFQAVNSDGIAIQSMRSNTFVIGGQKHVMCSGCHEPRWQGAPNTDAIPTAFTRAPSTITPDSVLKDDSQNPSEFFSYPRYIQPIWDANCISCHDGSPAPDLRTGSLNGDGWSASYVNLKPYVWIPQKVYNYYGFCDWDRNYPRTVPGDYGARDSSLYTKLTTAGHDTYLSADELHTVVLWLDSGIGQYYGAYTDTTAQNNGDIVEPAYH